MIYYFIFIIIVLVTFLNVFDDFYNENFSNKGLCSIDDLQDVYSYDKPITWDQCKSKIKNHQKPSDCRVKWVPIIHKPNKSKKYNPNKTPVASEECQKSGNPQPSQPPNRNQKVGHSDDNISNKIENGIQDDQNKSPGTNVNNVATTKINYN